MRQDSACGTLFLPLRDENVEQTIITNLTPYTKYEVLVNPFNKIGPGPASSKAIVSTLEGGKFESARSYQHYADILNCLGFQCPVEPRSWSTVIQYLPQVYQYHGRLLQWR